MSETATLTSEQVETKKAHLFMFLDEAWDTGLKGSKYFIIITLLTNRPKEISNGLRRIKSALKKREAKKKHELKFYGSSDRIKVLVLKFLKRKDIEIGCFVLRKNKVVEDSHGLYVVWADNLIKNSLLGNSLLGKRPLSVEIVLDKRLPKSYEEMLNKQVEGSVKNLFEYEAIVKIYHKDSKQDNCLQAADFVSGAIFYNYEHNNSSFYNIIGQQIKSKVVEE